jgi:hypothetical protein
MIGWQFSLPRFATIDHVLSTIATFLQPYFAV